nr:MAG TPA_asm: hypothetical protein [Caudoviricetes sp.]
MHPTVHPNPSKTQDVIHTGENNLNKLFYFLLTLNKLMI